MSIIIQLQSLQKAYDSFRRARTGVGHFVVNLSDDGETVVLHQLRDFEGCIKNKKVVLFLTPVA